MNTPNSKIFRRFSIPYIIWLILLAVVPLIVMFILSFMTTDGVGIVFPLTLDNFVKLGEPSIRIAFWNSIKYAGIATIVCGVIGYLVAYAVFCSKKIKNKFLILTIFLLPMWSNLLLRVNALKSLLQPNNIITNLFHIEKGLEWSGTGIAVVIGLVITYLPFMILPIYSALEKIDDSLQEASQDLGVTGIRKFWKVIFPLSAKGVFTGSILVFLPCASGFAVPKIMGEGNIVLIGNVIEDSISYMDYNLGSLLAIIILVVILGFLAILSKVDSKGETLI